MQTYPTNNNVLSSSFAGESGNRALIFIHGLAGSNQGFKAVLLRRIFPDILVPHFVGSLEERMSLLESTLNGQPAWTIIGSSLGGLMATLFTRQNPNRVKKLILLAPALTWPAFAGTPPDPINVPAVVFHGRKDTLIPLREVRPLAEKVFLDLDFHVVDDDHMLHATVQAIDWVELVGRD